MRVLSSSLLSLVIHGLVLTLVLLGPIQTGKPPVDLDQPVYEVELVRPPQPEPEPEEPTEQSEKAVEEKQQQKKKQEKQATNKKKQAEPQAARARQKQPEKTRAEKIPRKSRAPKREQPKAEKRTDPEKRQARKKPRAERTPTGDKVLDKALQDLRKQVDTRREQEQELASALKELRQQGQSRRSGQAGSAQKQKIYASLVEQRIKGNWRFPPVSGQSNLVAEVTVQIGPEGAISDYTLVRGSGRSDFDNSVLGAVEETESLPKPPEDLKTISITFNLRELRR